MASPVKPPQQAGFTAEPTAPFPWPGTKKEDKDESLFDKMATLGRSKKKIKEG